MHDAMHDKAHDKAHDKTHDKTHDRYFVYVSNAYDGEIAVLHLDAARGALTLASRCAGGRAGRELDRNRRRARRGCREYRECPRGFLIVRIVRRSAPHFSR